jgi:hypothetical protein
MQDQGSAVSEEDLMQRQRFARISAAWQPLFQTFVLRVLQATNPPFVQLGDHPLYEGNRLAVTQNSDIAVADFQRVAGYFDITHDVIHTTDIRAFVAALVVGALDIGRSRQLVFVRQLDEILEKTGRSFDNEQQPLTSERFLWFLDKVEFSFDETGQWQPPTLFVPPALFETAQRVSTEWFTDPHKAEQLKALIQRKWEAHHDREAHRELVD